MSGRPSAARRGYGYEWQKRRIAYLARNPWCRGAPDLHGGRPFWWHRATEVDHITPLRLGGADDDSNLQPLCKSAHSTKTALESAARRAVEREYPPSAWAIDESAEPPASIPRASHAGAGAVSRPFSPGGDE